MNNIRKRMQMLHRVIDRQRVQQMTISQYRRLIIRISQLLVDIRVLKQFANILDTEYRNQFKMLLDSCGKKIRRTLLTI